MEKTIDILKVACKGKYLDVLERFHVYAATK
jgi:hypothetical protein